MRGFKLILALSLIELVRGQDVYTAYSPGQYSSPVGGQYRATPRLVPVVKVRPLASAKTYPFKFNSIGQRAQESSQLLTFQTQTPVNNDNKNNGQYLIRQHPSHSRHIRIRSRPPQFFHYTTNKQQQNGQGRVLKRVRVASPYSEGLDQPVQFTQSVPAVATYRPQKSQQIAYQQQQPLAQNPQPAYYNQPRVQQGVRPVLKAQSVGRLPVKGQEREPEEPEYPSDNNPQYNFAFDVKDDDFTNYQNRQEQREGGITKGSYSVVDPDGYVRTVTYEASPTGGFKAKVTREPTDVKIKFPVPTEAPESEGKLRSQPAYQPQQQYAQAQYHQAFPQPAYNSRGLQQQGHRLVPAGRYPQ